MNKFQKAIEAFDEANSKDPNKEVVNGTGDPKELLYAQRMTETLNKYYPDASEELQLAARCQHIERWVIPRSDYPSGRKVYLKWRNDLKDYHARRAGEILEETGYDDETIKRIQKLIMKKGIKTDHEVQILEDVICLVFLRWYFEDFAQKHEDEKLIRILKKTLRKMSADGRDRALKLSLSEHAEMLIKKALY